MLVRSHSLKAQKTSTKLQILKKSFVSHASLDLRQQEMKQTNGFMEQLLLVVQRIMVHQFLPAKQ